MLIRKTWGRSDPPPFFWRAIIVWRWNSAGGPRDLQRSGRPSRVRDLARRRADHDPGDGDFLFEPGAGEPLGRELRAAEIAAEVRSHRGWTTRRWSCHYERSEESAVVGAGTAAEE